MTTVVRYSKHGRSRTSRVVTSIDVSNRRPQPEHISLRLPRFRRTQSFKVFSFSCPERVNAAPLAAVQIGWAPASAEPVREHLRREPSGRTRFVQQARRWRLRLGAATTDNHAVRRCLCAWPDL